MTTQEDSLREILKTVQADIKSAREDTEKADKARNDTVIELRAEIGKGSKSVSDVEAKLTRIVEDEAKSATKLQGLEEALNQVIRATTQRIEYLAVDVRNLEGLMAKGLTTRRSLDERRTELTSAQQRKDDSQNQILKLRAEKTDLETQRDRELRQSEFSLNEARRQEKASIGGSNG